jgi:hypothetical protein
VNTLYARAAETFGWRGEFLPLAGEENFCHWPHEISLSEPSSVEGITSAPPHFYIFSLTLPKFSQE